MKLQIKLYAAALGGAFLLVIADLLANIDAATTLKLGDVVEKYVVGSTDMGSGMVGLLLVLLLSLFFCWLYSPEDKIAAFTRGFSVFAVLSAATPYSADGPSQKIVSSHGFTLFPTAYAESREEGGEGLACRVGVLEPDATLMKQKQVSSCKPHASGFLGVGSFFNNSIDYCESAHTLPDDERVRLLETSKTGFRGYRYSKIEFQADNEICSGWVADGRGKFRYVMSDK